MLTFLVIILGLTLIAGAVLLGVYIYQIFELCDEFRSNPVGQIFMDCYRQAKHERLNTKVYSRF